MISAEILTNEDGMITGYRVSGHSGTAAHGEDIVCAGVSALTQSALLGIMEHLHRAVSYDMASGNLSVRLITPPDDYTEAILHTMYMGLAEIEKISPKGIRIQEVKG
ncbi:ribosomal-processing cysteine protease Prp [uncultured Selenomonas sp.]|uniref:ribosomal-processing cysteine protease Prp n=1 Tax=uncultured Selenomonas sp. TaxID=159275 RepID=UPI0028D3AEC8|nr:ribosomal-processing cysteine protease Prp [uncultured Selenomonas sp.]